MRYIKIICIVFSLIGLTTALTFVRLYGLNNYMGDTAQFYLQLQNVANGLGAYNPIIPSLLEFISKGYGSLDPLQLCSADFTSKVYTEDQYNHFKFHTYFILYPASLFLHFFKVEFVVQWLTIFSFISFAYIAYWIARKQNVNKLISALIALCICFMPAWSWAIQGQPYVDRWYFPFGLLIFYFTDKKKNSYLGLLFLLVISSLIVEKVLVYNTLFLAAYSVLFFNKNEKKIFIYRISLSIISFLVFLAVIKLFLSNFYYSGSTLPTSLNDALYLLTYPNFINGALTLFLISLPMLVPSVFVRQKLLLISLLMLLPNFLGNIGGAEKTGFFTHYHTLYYPFLVYGFIASTATIVNNLNILKIQKAITIFYLIITLIFYYFISINSSSKISFNTAHSLNFLNYFYQGAINLDLKQKTQELINTNIPTSAKVTAIEAGLPFIYLYNDIHFYPINLGKSDYLIISYQKNGDQINFTGFSGYRGKEDTDSANICLQEIIKKDYDTENFLILNKSLVLLKHR